MKRTFKLDGLFVLTDNNNKIYAKIFMDRDKADAIAKEFDMKVHHAFIDE